jgi:transposase
MHLVGKFLNLGTGISRRHRSCLSDRTPLPISVRNIHEVAAYSHLMQTKNRFTLSNIASNIRLRTALDLSERIAGMIIDKFAYHQPLYRQHVKLQDAGINVSRAWVTKLMPAAVSLIEPIFDAQLDSLRLSRVIAMDETPIKAGRAGPGKMKAAYFWPVIGEQDEICFLYYPSRAAKHIEDALGLTRPNGAVLQSDGYSAYAHYAKKTGITYAQCWAHSRRKIYDARDIEPTHADQALAAIAALYKVEQQIRNDGLTGQAKRARRQEQSKPVLDRFFAWIDEQFDKQGFLPSSPFLGALAYIRERRVGLSVNLDDP